MSLQLGCNAEPQTIPSTNTENWMVEGDDVWGFGGTAEFHFFMLVKEWRVGYTVESAGMARSTPQRVAGGAIF